MDKVAEKLDTSDVDKYVGKSIPGGHLKEPVSVTEIRRWVQALDYPNPRHFEEEAAAKSRFGEIVAPQSYTINCDVGHGSIPAMVGLIPGSHVMFGGDEFWFNGPRIRPGDKVRVERKFDGYSLAETRFAGPTLFARGDTLYVNQRNEPIAKQRSTMVRYRVDLARERDFYQDASAAPEFTPEQLREFKRVKAEWIRSGASGEGPGEVKVGDTLPTRLMGPHTAGSFAMEFSALTFSVWGASWYEDGYVGLETGWIPELMAEDTGDPMANLALNEGPASGHTNPDKAKLVGMPRNYGYGSSMGSWVLDYLAYWAGDLGFIRHAKIDYRSPVFEGDVSYFNAEVTDVRFDPLLGVQLATVKVKMTSQDGATQAAAVADVELRPL